MNWAGFAGRSREVDARPAVPADLLDGPLDGLLETLRSGDKGLSRVEAARRLAAGGPNRIESHAGPTLLRSFLARFRNPLILILIAAAGVSAAAGDAPSFVIIAAIVLLSVVLDVVQEYRAQNAAARLREQVALTTKVLRDGEWIEAPAANLVPGDVIQLAAGDLIPADCRLLAARDLYVNEALLTGESFPAEKEAFRENPAGAFPRDAIYMGTSVVSGTAKAIVAVTGRRTQLGSIAGSLKKAPPPTAFALGIRDFGRMIVRLTILLVLFTLLVNLLFHRPPLESFLFALALAVGLTPELLPMVVSVTLAHGAIRLSRQHVIVKRLSAIHDLGSMDVLCSDKTGTLTEANIRLMREVDLTGQPSGSAMKLALINARFETGLKSPLDEAILAAGQIDLAAWKKLDEAPFDFERRRVSVLAEGEGRRLLIVKGAPEDILAISSRYEGEAGPPRLLDAAASIAGRETFKRLGAEGFRVLGVAWRAMEPSCVNAAIPEEKDLVFAGFLAFLDPPKLGADAAIAALANLGVAVKIVTGDSEDVTRHVCQALNVAVQGTLTGPEITGLSDEALSARLDQTTLFCRVTPQQKSRIITALRRKGHVVGYLGDGINDAPSLQAADVGFSVDTGTDVAKEAACMILLRKDLGVLADGVREGRRTYANILKYVMMGTSSNFGNMFSMAGGAVFLPFLPMLPIQILFNNLLYDLSEIAIPMDRVDDAMLMRPRRWDIGIVQKFMFLLGPISSVFDFATFWLLLRFFGAPEVLFHTGWFIESLATQVLVIFVIRTARPFRNLPHPALALSSLVAVGIALLIPYTPFGGWLGFTPMPAAILGALALVTFAYLTMVYALRRWFFLRHGLT